MSNTGNLRWLVANRSRNQETTLKIYECYKEWSPLFILDDRLRLIAQRLTSATFSLWRAAFLSDIDNRKDLMVEDAVSFLENLVLNNSVAYTNDRSTKNYTFRFYVQHARDRIEQIKHEKDLNLIPNKLKSSMGLTAHEWWETNQDDLDTAVKNFDQLLKATGVKISN